MLIFVGTCLTGISKVIASNCVLNLINEYIGKHSQSKEFVYGCFYFLEKVITGSVLYYLIKQVYKGEGEGLLHFSWIYLPFILYATSWILVMIDRSIKSKIKSMHIQIMEADKALRDNVVEQPQASPSEEEN